MIELTHGAATGVFALLEFRRGDALIYRFKVKPKLLPDEGTSLSHIVYKEMRKLFICV